MLPQSSRRDIEHLSYNSPGPSPKDRDGSMSDDMKIKLRAELKRQHYDYKESLFGEDSKYHWRSGSRMFELNGLMPETWSYWSLQRFCNKPTMLYWALSAQDPTTKSCPGMVFACIYKAWFRCHGNHPDIAFDKFFATPFQITAAGPQTIPEILKTHAQLCDRVASQLQSIKSVDVGSSPPEWRHRQHYNLLPLCRAIIVLLDKLPSRAIPKSDGKFYLDDEVQRRTAVLILTGYDYGLSCAISFDAIRSRSLPLNRDDVDTNDSSNVIRVSLKAAVEFIAELQRREEKAFPSCSAVENEIDDVFYNDEEYVDDILDNLSASQSKQMSITLALKEI